MNQNQLTKEKEDLLERIQTLFQQLRRIEDQLIQVANHVGAVCGQGLPTGSGDSLAEAIIRKIEELKRNNPNDHQQP